MRISLSSWNREFTMMAVWSAAALPPAREHGCTNQRKQIGPLTITATRILRARAKRRGIDARSFGARSCPAQPLTC